MAAKKGHLEVATLLIESHADVNKATIHRRTPLFIAAYYGHLEIAKLLIESHANINQATTDEETPLYIAAETRHLNIVKLLIEHKANIHLKTTDGKTALDIATEKGVIEVLKKHQMNMYYINEVWTACENGNIEQVQSCISKGAGINAIMNDSDKRCRCQPS
jgi:ankyrin repeat protein